MLGRVLSRLGAVVGAGALAVGGLAPAPAALAYRSAIYAAALQVSGISISARGLGLYGTATIAGNQGVDCLEADVNPATLALSDIFEPRCDDPRMSGYPVVPVEATVDRGNYISVRVARVDPAAGRIEVGPVLGTDEDASDTRPQWVYGPGSLWLYLAAPKGSPSAGKALRVSVTTGQLMQATEVVPALFRPVMAADANGLYLSPAVNGGSQASPGTANAVIFHVGLGATKSDVFYRWPSGQWYGFADWMSGYGDHLSADLCQRGGSALKCVLAGFEGANARPDLLRAEPYFDGWALGGPSTGFFTSMVPAGEGSAPLPTTIVRIDSSTGRVRRLTTVVLPAYWGFLEPDGNPGAALYDGALYLLGSSGPSDQATLYRIAVPEGT